MVKTILIIPAYNEEKTIGAVLDESKKYCSDILVIDDGSTDRTAEICRQKRVEIISNIINRGLGISIKRGYQEALNRGADIIVQTDADGQYTLSDIPRLIEPIFKNEADMVIASRFRGGIESMSRSKIIGNKIGTIVTRLVSGFKTTDAQSGFRAMRRELIEEIQPTNKMTYVQEMIIRTAKEGWRIKEIPSFFKKRGGDGRSRLIGNVFSYAKRAVVIIIRAMLEYHPLIFFGLPGLILFVLGFLIGIDLTVSFFQGVSIERRVGAIVLSSLSLLAGLIFFSIGLLADFFQSQINRLKK